MELLDDAAIAAAIDGRAWVHQGSELVRAVRCSDFSAALDFVRAVGTVAERLGHHPDIDIRWITVTLRLSTHSRGGVTDADLALAAALDPLC